MSVTWHKRDRTAELQLQVRRVRLLRQHGGGEEDLGMRAGGDLVGVLISRENTTAIISFQE